MYFFNVHILLLIVSVCTSILNKKKNLLYYTIGDFMQMVPWQHVHCSPPCQKVRCFQTLDVLYIYIYLIWTH